MKKFFKLLLYVAVLGGAGWYANSKQWFGLIAAKGEQSQSAESPTARVELRNIDFSVQVSGDVSPVSKLDVKAEVGGKVKEIHVLAGDSVKQGQLLVEIDDRDILTEKESAMTEIAGAELQMEKARRNNERGQELFAQKLISQEAFDNLATEHELAKNSLDRAKRKVQIVDDKLSKTKVTAPNDGTVLEVPVTEGQVIIPAASVNNGTTLMTIANLDRLLVESHVNQVDVAKLRPKQRVKLRAESIKDGDMEAEIFFIAPIATIKSSVKGFAVQALIDKPSSALRPGMTVSLSVPIDHASDAVSVPVSAVFRSEGNKRVVFVVNGMKTEKREVKLGVSNVEHAQILTGLKEGEEILLINPERAVKKRSGA
jgi:RND family efflux transporter MFP subunit